MLRRGRCARAGIEASPYFVAVGQDVLARARSDGKATAERVHIRHGLAEATGVPDGSADVVTMCLVMHELPAHASRDVMREALRCAPHALVCPGYASSPCARFMAARGTAGSSVLAI